MHRIRDITDAELTHGDRVHILGSPWRRQWEHLGDDGTIVQIGAATVGVLVDGDIEITQWRPSELALLRRRELTYA